MARQCVPRGRAGVREGPLAELGPCPRYREVGRWRSQTGTRLCSWLNDAPRYAGQRPVTTACIKQHSCLIMIMIMRSINLLLHFALILTYCLLETVYVCMQGCVSVIHWARTVRHVTLSLSSAPVNPAWEIPSVTALRSTTGVCPRSPKATAAVCVSLSSSHYKTSLKLRYARLCLFATLFNC